MCPLPDACNFLQGDSKMHNLFTHIVYNQLNIDHSVSNGNVAWDPVHPGKVKITLGLTSCVDWFPGKTCELELCRASDCPPEGSFHFQVPV